MHTQHTTTRRRSRVVLAVGAVLVAAATGVLTPTAASAAPGSAAEAAELVRKTAQELTVIDEQVHEARMTVAEQQRIAEEAAAHAATAQAAVAAFEPQMRAIAHTGYTGKTRSRVAAFLTSGSADELVQQMTTLDLIADHTNGVIAQVAAAQAAAEQAQATADQAAAAAKAGLEQVTAQQAELEKQIADHRADYARLSAAEQARVATALAGPALATPSAGSLPDAPSGAAAAAVQAALGQVGDPYVWGASGPDGFDCSGLTSYAYAAAGISLPHSSRAQSQLGREVPRSELQPGDLVYFYSPVSHVGLYIGNGMMVHARTFGRPVAVTSVDQNGYRGARRLVG
ncbi:C40 family peptidase [Blastococcus sp. SYSU DS0616]